MASKLAPAELEATLLGAARNVTAGFGTTTLDVDEISAQSKRVSKALPWLSKKGFEDGVRRFLAAGEPQFGRWSERTELTAARAAVVLSDDLAGSLAVLMAESGDARGDAVVGKMRVINDVMQFASEDATMTLRRRLSMPC